MASIGLLPPACDRSSKPSLVAKAGSHGAVRSESSVGWGAGLLEPPGAQVSAG